MIECWKLNQEGNLGGSFHSAEAFFLYVASDRQGAVYMKISLNSSLRPWRSLWASNLDFNNATVFLHRIIANLYNE